MEALRPPAEPRYAPDLRAFAATIRGRTILPSDAAFDEARQVHNALIDRRPALIVRASGPDDVARTVQFARESGRDIAIRSGGHSLAGHSVVDDGVVIDLSAMKGLHIDPDRRLAWAQAGLTAGEYTAAAGAHGLATPFGDTGSVGLGGLTLGGGIGYLARKHGLAIDSLVSVEMVLADGSVVTASETAHPDLFWAVRGGGGNFGVVTRFQYRLHPVGMVLGGALILPATPEVVRGLIPVAKAAPEELTMIAAVMPLPPLPFLPPEAHGQLGVMIIPVFAGDPEAGQRAMDPFRALATPIADALAPMPYPAIYELMADAEQRMPSLVRSFMADDIDDAAADSIIDFMGRRTAPMVMAQLRVLGGAAGRVAPEATAFAHRERDVLVAFIIAAEGATEPHLEWVDGAMQALAPISRGVYSNFLEDEGDGRIRDAYPNGAYERLVQVKRRYDPTNVFHLNQNIRPAG